MVVLDDAYLNTLISNPGYEVAISRFWLKEGYEEKWKEWCVELNDRKEEIMKTLEQESVVLEFCILGKDVKTKSKTGYIVMFAVSLDHAYKVVRNNPHPIDLEHKEKRTECFERGEDFGASHSFNHEEYEILYWFDKRNRPDSLKYIE